MFGGLTKTSSRIALAAAFGLTLGGYALSSGPAQAADFGGDCCADLEERVAELEATTVRKGNKKVSVTLSGWVVKTMNWWDDNPSSFVVGDKDYDLGSRFSITGSATIAPGWSAGYNLTVLAPGDVFGFGSNQFNEVSGPGNISTLYSYMYVKSDTWGTVNWGSLSPASDNPAVLADLSGTVIESNAVFFEGNGFFLRPKGGPSGLAGLSGLVWGNFLTCQGLGAGIGADCWGAAQPAVRYDSPTWGGFRFETSYGTNSLTGPATPANSLFASSIDSNFWDIAVFYNGDVGNFKISATYAYTWIETAVTTGRSADLHQAGASILHSPSGLGVYGMYQHESNSGANTSAGIGSVFIPGFTLPAACNPFAGGLFGNCVVPSTAAGPSVTVNNPDSDVWYVKPFWQANFSPAGKTIFYGEYGNYENQYVAGVDILGGAGGNTAVFATGSEVERWGLGVVQEIDSAAMHLFARWQHQELNLDLVGVTVTPGTPFVGGGGAATAARVSQGFDDWDLFQVGGIIFF